MRNRLKLLAAAAILTVPAAALAQEGQAPDSEAETVAEAGEVTPATAADVHVGIEVRGPDGGMVGTVESIDAVGAVVSTGNVRAKLPFSSFGRNRRGLVISLTRPQLEAEARAQNPS